MDPGEGTAKWLSEYGPWAVVVLCLVAIGVLWRRMIARDVAIESLNKAHDLVLEALHKEHNERVLAITKEHKAEMAAVVDRLIASSNAQVDKFSNLAEQNARVVEALTRRVQPKPKGDG